MENKDVSLSNFSKILITISGTTFAAFVYINHEQVVNVIKKAVNSEIAKSIFSEPFLKAFKKVVPSISEELVDVEFEVIDSNN